MKRWGIGAIVTLLGVSAVACLPGWLRARRAQADFDAFLAGHPRVRIERIRTLSASEVAGWDSSGSSAWGAEVFVRLEPPDFSGIERFLEALQSHETLGRTFRRLHLNAQASDTYKKGFASLVLLTSDSWISLRPLPGAGRRSTSRAGWSRRKAWPSSRWG